MKSKIIAGAAVGAAFLAGVPLGQPAWADEPATEHTVVAQAPNPTGDSVQDFSRWQIRVRALGVVTDTSASTVNVPAAPALNSPASGLSVTNSVVPELDITYTLSVESDALVARSIWTEAPIAFGPSIADRFDARDGRLPTIVIERDAAGRAVALRIMAEYLRNVRLERRADVRPGPMITASTPPRHSPAPRGVRGADRDSAGNGVGR